MSQKAKAAAKNQESEPPSRHNLAIADIKAHISAIFEPLIDKTYAAGINQWKKNKKFGFNQKHINAANHLEDTRNRILEGFRRLDKTTTWEDFNAIADRIMEITEDDLPKAMQDFMNAFLDAVQEAVKDDLT